MRRPFKASGTQQHRYGQIGEQDAYVSTADKAKRRPSRAGCSRHHALASAVHIVILLLHFGLLLSQFLYMLCKSCQLSLRRDHLTRLAAPWHGRTATCRAFGDAF